MGPDTSNQHQRTSSNKAHLWCCLMLPVPGPKTQHNSKTTASDQLAHMFCVCVRGKGLTYQQVAVVCTHHSNGETGRATAIAQSWPLLNHTHQSVHSLFILHDHVRFDKDEQEQRRLNLVICPKRHHRGAASVNNVGITLKTSIVDTHRWTVFGRRLLVSLDRRSPMFSSAKSSSVLIKTPETEQHPLFTG